jgi:hypothetical protein
VSNNLALDLYLGLNNYLNSWKRIGFSDEDITQPSGAPEKWRVTGALAVGRWLKCTNVLSNVDWQQDGLIETS